MEGWVRSVPCTFNQSKYYFTKKVTSGQILMFIFN